MVPRMSVFPKATAHFGLGSANDPSILAICMLGTRFGGTLKTAQGGYTFIFVAIDKFTKWIEVKPVSATTAAKAVEFI